MSGPMVSRTGSIWALDMWISKRHKENQPAAYSDVERSLGAWVQIVCDSVAMYEAAACLSVHREFAFRAQPQSGGPRRCRDSVVIYGAAAGRSVHRELALSCTVHRSRFRAVRKLEIVIW